MAVEVGIRVPHDLFGQGADALGRFVGAVKAAGLDRIWVGDHVSFRGGQGYDGLLQAAMLATLSRRVIVQTAVYLLPLRHPLPVARQVASVAELAPGRLSFGVGVGGDDPAEVANCGVDPRRRGRRMDESVDVLRALLEGKVVDHVGDELRLRGALVRPVPDPQVPIIVGGRSDAAHARAGRVGDGWLGVFVSPERFAAGISATGAAATRAERSGVDWQHGLVAWCGFGRDLRSARPALAAAMERLYQQPFERFARFAPHGRPGDVAESLAPYVSAGATTVLLAAVSDDADASVASAAEVRALLRGDR